MIDPNNDSFSDTGLNEENEDEQPDAAETQQLTVDPLWDNAQFILCASSLLSLTHAGVTDLCDASSFVEKLTENVYSDVIRTLFSHDIPGAHDKTWSWS